MVSLAISSNDRVIHWFQCIWIIHYNELDDRMLIQDKKLQYLIKFIQLAIWPHWQHTTGVRVLVCLAVVWSHFYQINLFFKSTILTFKLIVIWLLTLVITLCVWSIVEHCVFNQNISYIGEVLISMKFFGQGGSNDKKQNLIERLLFVSVYLFDD